MVVIAWLVGMVVWLIWFCFMCMLFAIPFVIVMTILDKKKNPKSATPSRSSRRKLNHTPSGPGIMERVATRKHAAAAAAHKAQEQELLQKIRRERNPENVRIYKEMLMRHRGEL